MAALTAVGCRLLADEVFEYDDLAAELERGSAFFALCPIRALEPLAGR